GELAGSNTPNKRPLGNFLSQVGCSDSYLVVESWTRAPPAEVPRSGSSRSKGMPVGAYSRALLRRAVSSVRGRVLIAGAVVLLVVTGAFAAATEASKGRPKHAPLSKK